MVFRVDDGAHGPEPWTTDGTAAGTGILRDLCPGACRGAAGTDDAGVADLPAGRRLLFSGNNGVRGMELWVTDGTAAGTRLVRDLCRGGCSSFPFALSAGTGEVFLLGRNVDGVPQLWRSDGTSPGTVRLTSFQSSAAFGSSLGIPLGGDFLFTADDGDRGLELWHSDGTPQGTRLFLDVNLEDLGGSFPTALRSAAGKVWFFANDGINGAELWSSDGTEEGTVLVHEFFPGEEPAFPPPSESSADSGGRLFFVVNLGELNFSLWSSAGAPGTTLRLTPPDVGLNRFEHLRAVGGLVFFAATDSTNGEELWVSDGTPAGTRVLADLEPGLEGSQPRSLTLFQGRLFFTASVGEAGRELWTSDGTPAGTFLVKDLDPRPNRGSEPHNLTLHAGRLLFSAADEEHGLELWSTDGTAAGTKLDAEFVPGPDGFLMTHLVSAGTHLYFSGGPPSLAEQGLWISDGTEAGTRRASDTLIQIDSRLVAAPGILNGQIFFAKTGDQVLWTSDGTEEGTFPLRTAEGMEICEPESFVLFGGLMLFSAEGELYTSDGTQEGTHKILGLAAPNEVEVFELMHAGARLLFRKWDRFTGSELWALEED
jgi:ELWxxDGT repeat protein